MRTALCIVVLVFAASAAASADICPKCAGKVFAAPAGVCPECKKNEVAYGGFKYCAECSKRLGRCEVCGLSLAEVGNATRDAAAAKVAEARKQVFLADVPSFIMTLRYWGPEDKPFYWLTLCRQMHPTTAVYQFDLTGVMDKETTVKAIEWLASSGVLAKAEELGVEEKTRRAPTGPCYSANITCGKMSLLYNFGWGAEFAKKMMELRALLPNNADEKMGPSPAKQMDAFLGRLSGYWKEWTGKPYEAPKGKE